jgi:hypothetical protein
MSSVPPSIAKPPAKQIDASVKWEAMGDLGSLHRVGGVFVSRGHFAGRWKAEVLVNPGADPSITALGPTTRFSVGSLLVQKHRDAGSGAGGPIYAMVKRDAGYFPEGGDWEYIATDADGWIEDRGALVLCARCHAEAQADRVFPLPRDGK